MLYRSNVAELLDEFFIKHLGQRRTVRFVKKKICW